MYFKEQHLDLKVRLLTYQMSVCLPQNIHDSSLIQGCRSAFIHIIKLIMNHFLIEFKLFQKF